MASMIDKTVTSKYQPKSTNVIWVDTSLNPPVEKHFINGRWKPISGGGGGTKKYSDLEEKPSINGVELDGNKTSQDLGVYSKPTTGIPESDLSSDVQQALQKHFKGWYETLEELKADYTATDGDSAYVKDASPATTWSIYVYDATATTDNNWADSGTDADTSNVQTFASSEEVNETYIDDTHLVNPADGALSTAEDVMQLKAKLEGVTASEVKASNYLVADGFIACRATGSRVEKHYYTNSTRKTAFIPIGTSKAVRFLGFKANYDDPVGYVYMNIDNISTFIAGLTNNQDLSSYIVSINPYEKDTNIQEMTEPVEIASDNQEGANYIALFYDTNQSSDYSVKDTNFYCYLQYGKTIKEYVDEVGKTESYCVFEFVQGVYLSRDGIVNTSSSSQITAYQIAYTKVHKGDIIHLRTIPRIMSVAQGSGAELRVGFSQSIPSNGIAVTGFKIYNSGAKVSNREIVDKLIEVNEGGYFYAYYPICYRIHVYDINCSTIISTKKDETIGVSQGRIYNGYPDGDKKYVTSDFIKDGVYFDLVCRDGYKINSVHLYNDSGKLICPNFIGESVNTGSRYRNRNGWGSILPPHIMARVTFVKNSNGCVADEDCLVEDSPIKSLTYLLSENGYAKDIPNSIEAAYPFVQYRTKTLVYLLSKYLRFKENATNNDGLSKINDYYNLNGRTYYGVSYSDTRELPTVVGQDISIYTYLTALSHKYSVVYTEDRFENSSMYGLNYMSGGFYNLQYFEMACNMFWGYCMGEYAMKLTEKAVQSGYTKVFAGSASPSGNISDSVQTFDTLLKSGHVAFVLDVIKKDNEVKYIVVAESTTPLTRITVYPKNAFDEYYMSNVGSNDSPDYYDVWRKNTAIDANTYYQPFDSDNDEYVAHSSENYPYIGSPKECMLYVGDRASLNVDSPVYVNANRGYGKFTKINLYKNNNLIQEISIGSLTKIANDPDGEDWVSVNLTSYIDGYGKYKAVASNSDGSVISNETVWEIIDISLSVTPTIATFSVSGGKPYIIQEEAQDSGFLRFNCDLLEATDTTHNISSFTNNPKIALYAMGDYGVVKKVVDRVTN